MARNLMFFPTHSLMLGNLGVMTDCHFVCILLKSSLWFFCLKANNLSLSSSCRFAYFPVTTSSVWKFTSQAAILLTPSSFNIASDKAFALAWNFGSVQTVLMASPSSLDFNFPSCFVYVPHSMSWRCLALSNWSAKTGVMMVGHPADRDACSVPMPPWCIAALHCGKSSSWGAALMKRMFSSHQALNSSSFSAPSSPSGPSCAQPAKMMAFSPARLQASTASFVMCSFV
mmetsp:Transcript_49799/g.100278  ORF Transcript_49799/g.100278 Transcript_49799/m.100278 type:complete len:229 (-) Transcript_49799:868-1554(-)